MTLSATFSAGAGLLSVLGDGLGNSITVSRNAAENLLVNGGAVSIQGDQPTVANTAQIEAFGQGGDDTIGLDETNGALPSALLSGGAGNDVLTGGAGADLLFGGAGNDSLAGKGGADQLFGGAGNDVLTGGAGNDQVFGEAGNDRMIWNPGDGSDVFEGGAGTDTAEVNGGIGAEQFTITANGGRVQFDRVSPAPFSIDIGTSENLVLNANGGDDVITAGNGLAGLIQLTIDGGAGNDTITGGDGNDKLIGGEGNDVITGGRGNDVASLGAGDDVFVWNPGDGSDVVEGEAGVDTLQFNGAGVDENMTISAHGSRAELFRNVGNVTMDLGGVERIQVAALGGADTITVDDLTGTDVKQVAIDLSSSPGSNVGDGQADTVVINATNGDDAITVTNNNGVVTVSGLASEVTISGFDATDRIVINGLGGADVVNASGLSGIELTANGGRGDDVLIGGAGNDSLNGGAGDDVLVGGSGQDALDGGSGRNILIQDARFVPPVDGSLAARAPGSVPGSIDLSSHNGSIDLSGIGFDAHTTLGYSANNDNTGGTLTVSDGVHAASLALLGQYMASSFVMASDGHGGTLITDPPSSQQPSLAQPHA